MSDLIEDLDPSPRTTEQQRTHALTWMNRSLAVIAAASVAGLAAFVVLEGIDRLPAPPVVERSAPVVTVTPPPATELPTPKLIDQYPILQRCVVEDEDNCFRDDEDGDGPGHAFVTIDGMTYWLDSGDASLLNGRG